ncbi:hypothetical protein AJ88_18125 [Mesorhizobium amorphae CCBAU 01583]|nr:hypothetical protein AJ88_18125 [Mesorhizobium amorphae CCBAU 01583]
MSNFVSGLILLAERPFKVGDWIVAGEISGTVKKISVRATEIETFQRQSVILPNSNLINNAVGNWTHRNKLGRIDIKVGVAYGSDVKRVHALLLEIARGHPLVLKNPEPFVQFTNFGAAALEFEIRVFLADVLNGAIVQNDIASRFSMFSTASISRSPRRRAPRSRSTRHGRSTTTRSRPSSPSARRRKPQPRSRGNAWRSQSARAASPTRIRSFDPVPRARLLVPPNQLRHECGIQLRFSLQVI